MIQSVKTLFLEATPYTTISTRSDYQEIFDPLSDDKYTPVFRTEAFPTTSTSGFEQEPEDHDSFINDGGASQVQSWQFVGEELSNCIHQSLNSSDCVSQTFVGTTGRVACDPRKSRVQRLGQIQEQSNHVNMDDDVHYQGVISTIFKTTHQLILGPQFQNFDKQSSFTRWKRSSSVKTLGEKSQKMIKKILFEVPLMNKKEELLPDTPEEAGNHALSEKKRREKLNERFMTLRSIIPSISKVTDSNNSVSVTVHVYVLIIERNFTFYMSKYYALKELSLILFLIHRLIKCRFLMIQLSIFKNFKKGFKNWILVENLRIQRRE